MEKKNVSKELKNKVKTEDEKIVLTSEQFAYLEHYMDGYVDFKACNENEQKVWTDIFDKIDYFEEKFEATDEIMAEEACDRVIWFYKRYMIQNGREPKEPTKYTNKKFICD